MRDRRIKRISFGWHSIPTSFPLRNIPIERSVLRIPRNVLFTRSVSMPCFRSIKGSAISWKPPRPSSRLFPHVACAHLVAISIFMSAPLRSRALRRHHYAGLISLAQLRKPRNRNAARKEVVLFSRGKRGHSRGARNGTFWEGFSN